MDVPQLRLLAERLLATIPRPADAPALLESKGRTAADGDASPPASQPQDALGGREAREAGADAPPLPLPTRAQRRQDSEELTPVQFDMPRRPVRRTVPLAMLEANELLQVTIPASVRSCLI